MTRPRFIAVCAALAGALVAVSLSGCASPIKTAYDAAPGTDFSKYKTYAFVTEDLMSQDDPLASSYISPLEDARARKIVEKALDGKGLQKVPLDRADLAIAFSVTREQKVETRMEAGRSSVYYPSYGGGYRYAGPGVYDVAYTEGTLTIQLFDRRTRQAIWAGWGSKRLTKGPEPPETLELAIEHIMMKYPPPTQ